MTTQPQTCFDVGCPLAGKSTGFSLGTGDPRTAKFAIMLEALGSEEVSFHLSPEEGRRFYETQEACDKEIAIRQRDYPDLPLSYLTHGAPVVGKSGFEIFQWVLPVTQMRREDIFIDNTLRCRPPKHGDANYPDGPERKRAELCCRVYDRWNLFKPDISIVSIHPAAVLREPTPLWLQVKNFEKARDFVKQGYKTLILAGGKAAKWWLGYSENVTKWQGHYEFNDIAAQERRDARLEAYGNVNLTEKKNGHKKENDNVDTEREGSKGKRRFTAVEVLLGGL